MTYAEAYLWRLSKSRRPILVGPWRSELGFETLYWLPFLRWAVKRYGFTPDRIVTLTRGGAGVLYGTAGIDLYQLRSVETVRRENLYDWQQTKLQKQVRVTAWDRAVADEAVRFVCGRGTRYHLLHPALMYRTLAPWWDEVRGAKHLQRWTDYALLPKPKRPEGLPANYVAMKWYTRSTLDGRTEAVREFIARTVGVVGMRTPIVLLTGTPETDDHADIVVEHPAIVRMPVAPPDENLGRQLAVMAHARAFIGTYGGAAQTALRLGVPSASVWQQFGGTAQAHLTLSRMLSLQQKVPFLCGSLDDAALWGELFPQISVTTGASA